jgi:hypothetical protein
VEGHQAGAASHAREQRSHVGEADDRFGTANQRWKIDLAQDPGESKASADTPDPVDRWVAECGIEVCQPLLIGPSEVPVASPGVKAEDRFVISDGTAPRAC